MNRLFSAILGAGMTVGFGLALADDPVEDDKVEAAESLEMCSERTLEYTFLSVNDNAPFRLRAEPILKWTQPVYGTVYGYVYVWTAKGRPEVISSFLKWYQPYTHVTDEFHSLATGGITADRDGQRVWTSAKPGVELKPIPEAPEPAASPAARLRQIRDLAKEFSGREVDRNQVDRDMRLLTQPIYRYESPEGDVVDGALFAFAQGTDPDAILMIEARRVDGVPRWQYALVRMTTSALRVNHKSQEVWNVPLISYAVVYSHREPYTSFRIDGAKAISPPRPCKP